MKYRNASLDTVDKKIYDKLQANKVITETKNYYGEVEKKLTFKKGFFLFGITGSGKTHTLYAIANALRGDVHNWVEVLSEIKDRMSQNQNAGYVIDDITSRSFVFLDDVGAEKQTEWVQENLYLVIDRCYRYEKPLFISTNLTLEQFSERYGDRLLSRIGEMCELHEMEEVDKRLQK